MLENRKNMMGMILEGLNEAKMPTWAVTGQNPDDMRPKTVIVKAKDKESAIEKGLAKIGTKVFIECKLRST